MRTKWKQITYDKYLALNRGLSELEIALNNNTNKWIKDEVLYKDCIGAGLVKVAEITKINVECAIEPDDYEYFENDGAEYVIMGSEKSIKALEDTIECSLK